MMQRLVDLEMAIVAAVNGRAAVHSEYALLADVVIAADTAVFSDFPHLTFGLVPGDGIYLAWEEAIGVNRARYLTLTQGSFTAGQAERWGAVAEVLPPDQVLPRAREIAEGLAARPQLLTRYTAITVRQRLSRRMAAGDPCDMILAGPPPKSERAAVRHAVSTARRPAGTVHDQSDRSFGRPGTEQQEREVQEVGNQQVVRTQPGRPDLQVRVAVRHDPQQLAADRQLRAVPALQSRHINGRALQRLTQGPRRARHEAHHTAAKSRDIVARAAPAPLTAALEHNGSSAAWSAQRNNRQPAPAVQDRAQLAAGERIRLLVPFRRVSPPRPDLDLDLADSEYASSELHVLSARTGQH